jgi:DNA-binding phage protein
MKPLQIQDVLKLLRAQIDHVGGQSEYARQTGVNRVIINRVLNGRQSPGLNLCRMLGLQWVITDQTESVIIGTRSFHLILSEAIKEGGGISAWSRKIGVDRANLSKVLHKKSSPSQDILAALKLSEVLVRVNESKTVQRIPWRRTATGKKSPHARWK